MQQKKYWQNLGELKDSDAYRDSLKDEFAEELPQEAGSGLAEAKAPRRDFLKYVGFSTAAAMAAASCEMPVKKSIPYLNKPENFIPGVPDFYASTWVQDGNAVPVVVKVRDGRPIKIEGNELSALTGGGSSAQVQASVLDLYDVARLRYPLADGKEVTSFEAFDKMVSGAMAGVTGKTVLLTATVSSPTTLDVIARFLVKHPGSEHITYDALSASGMLLANQASYGRPALPAHRFDRARVIVSLGADFLGTWLNPVEYARQYAAGRRIDQAKPEMSKHIQIEAMLSLTGANADDRYVHRPSETGAVALALYAALGAAVTAPALSDERLRKGVAAAAAALASARGSALVVCGSNDPDVQVVVNAINEAVGANGTTLDWSATLNTRKGGDADMARLIGEMKAGKVGALLIHGVNPVYDCYDAKGFEEGLKKVSVTVSFNDREDETTERCKYAIPDHHYLESWGDAEPRAGHYSFQQPTIAPLFKTRAFQTSLLKWSGDDTEYADVVKAYWTGKLGGQEAWDRALRDGLIDREETNPA